MKGTVEIEVDAEGRLTLPKDVLEDLRLKGGGTLVAEPRGGKVLLGAKEEVPTREELEADLRAAQAIYHANAKNDLSVDEFIREKRAEERRDNERMEAMFPLRKAK